MIPKKFWSTDVKVLQKTMEDCERYLEFVPHTPEDEKDNRNLIYILNNLVSAIDEMDNYLVQVIRIFCFL